MNAQETLDVLGPPNVTFHEKPYRHYQIDGRRVASVTQVIGLMDKPALKHWAQREAVYGVAALVQQYGSADGIFRDADRLEAALIGMGREIDARSFVDLYADQQTTLPWERPWDILRLLKSSEESITARMKQAADRGVAIHAVFEDYATSGKVPDVDLFPEAHRGYLTALGRFITAHRPKFKAAELVVGSRAHSFGGRLDVLAYMEVGDHYGLLDLKTNAKGRVYAVEHFLQVEAYALATTECGHDVGDFRGVVAVGADGSFQFRRSFATADDFLALLPAFQMRKRLERLDKQEAQG